MQNHPNYNEIILVATATKLSEDDTDSAIVSTAKLIDRVIGAQQAANLQRFRAQPALTALAAAMNKHVEAREQIMLAHQHFGKVAALLGATETAWGDNWPCPPTPTTGHLEQGLPLTTAPQIAD